MPRSGYRRAFTTPEPAFHFPRNACSTSRNPCSTSRNRCSTSSEIDVPLRPKSVFHFLRNTQSAARETRPARRTRPGPARSHHARTCRSHRPHRPRPQRSRRRGSGGCGTAARPGSGTTAGGGRPTRRSRSECRGPAARPGASAPASPAAGSVKVNVVPRPAPALSARMRPPCASTSPLADGQPEPVARRRPRPALGVLAEQMRLQVGRHPPALVGDRDGDMRAIMRRRDPDRGRLRRVARGVGEELVEHLNDAPAVGHHRGQPRGQVDEDGVPAGRRYPGRCFAPAPLGRPLPRARGRPRACRVDAPRVEQVADEPAHVVCLILDEVGRTHAARPDPARPSPPLRCRPSP